MRVLKRRARFVLDYPCEIGSPRAQHLTGSTHSTRRPPSTLIHRRVRCSRESSDMALDPAVSRK